MPYQVMQTAAVEPVSLDELKAHSTIDFDDDDVYLSNLITVARSRFEDDTGLAVLQQTRLVVAPNRSTEVRLSCGPVRSVDRVYYIDADGDENDIDANSYDVNLFALEPYVTLKTTRFAGIDCRADAIRVEVTAGIALVNGSVIDGGSIRDGGQYQSCKQAIMILAGHLYANREMVAPVQLHGVPGSYQMFVDSLRVVY